MASRYEKFFDDAWNSIESQYQKGFIKEDVKERLTSNDDILYEIPLKFQYRPDRIAANFYGNPRLFWVLVYVNSIEDSPEGFYAGRRIRVPRIERITEVT